MGRRTRAYARRCPRDGTGRHRAWRSVLANTASSTAAAIRADAIAKMPAHASGMAPARRVGLKGDGRARQRREPRNPQPPVGVDKATGSSQPLPSRRNHNPLHGLISIPFTHRRRADFDHASVRRVVDPHLLVPRIRIVGVAVIDIATGRITVVNIRCRRRLVVVRVNLTVRDHHRVSWRRCRHRTRVVHTTGRDISAMRHAARERGRPYNQQK